MALMPKFKEAHVASSRWLQLPAYACPSYCDLRDTETLKSLTMFSVMLF